MNVQERQQLLETCHLAYRTFLLQPDGRVNVATKEPAYGVVSYPSLDVWEEIDFYHLTTKQCTDQLFETVYQLINYNDFGKQVGFSLELSNEKIVVRELLRA